MNLRHVDFPVIVDTSTSDIVDDFLRPALSCSTQYDRGVGYFSSGWLRINSKGLADFASNGGRARWVTSPILNSEDFEALKLGDDARTDVVLHNALRRNLHDLQEMLEQKTLSALAWMVADGILTFKLALPQNKLSGDFHDKFGVFTDSDGNRLAFMGSYNESVRGTLNSESFSIFPSWQNESLMPYVDAVDKRFSRLWDGEDPNVRVYDLPDAIREEILQLRSAERPYPLHASLQTVREKRHAHVLRKPHIPDHINLRDYQVEAIEAWFANNCRGLLEMATGTGKTFTALGAINQLFEQNRRLIVVIVCPYKHLVDQWATEAYQFGHTPIRVAESRTKWEGDVAQQLRSFRKGYKDTVTFIATNRALVQGRFRELMQNAWSDAVIVSDEVHYVGAQSINNSLPDAVEWRLGLSATPTRYYDDEGSQAIEDYFGKVVFRLPLEDAIGPFLTPYYYHPIPVEMYEDEFAEYCALTEKLRRHIRSDGESLTDAGQMIAIQRARVQNNSIAKLDWIETHIQRYAKLKYTLFYVGERIFADAQKLLGFEKRLHIHEFTHRQTSNEERQQILQRFGDGDLQALVAMKCLDEGVDVPPTRTAYFLASSGNPREFVQRRGRVLRLYPGKDSATIYDLVAIPPSDYIEMGQDHSEYNAIRAAVRREYRRIQEFASLAENRYTALDSMFDIVQQLNLLTME